MFSESDVGKKCTYWNPKRRERRPGVVAGVKKVEVTLPQSYFPGERLKSDRDLDKELSPVSVTVRDEETGEVHEVDWEKVSLTER